MLLLNLNSCCVDSPSVSLSLKCIMCEFTRLVQTSQGLSVDCLDQTSGHKATLGTH